MSRVRNLIIAAILIIGVVGCKTLSVTGSASHCDIKRGPPGTVVCTVDGKVRYKSTSKKALKVACPK